MTFVVFTGPTLPPAEAREVLDALYLPPVSEGDLYRAALKSPRAIGIIDGYFENVPSVWHKEILHAMARGIRVFGSASMGALRAAELAAFGMVGVGATFEAYRDGILEDDDEVAVIHGPAELGFPMLFEAMVNIRRTLSDAHHQRVISPLARTRLGELLFAEAERRGGQGHRHEAREVYLLAANEFAAAAEDDADNLTALRGAGVGFVRAGWPNRAIEHLEAAVALAEGAERESLAEMLEQARRATDVQIR